MTEQLVPDDLKVHIFYWYAQARSNDPMMKIGGTQNLCSSLLTAFKIAGVTEHDDLMHYCISQSNQALFELSVEQDWGRACKTCSNILDKVSIFIYDKRYCKTQTDDLFNTFQKEGQKK